jgi:hypothetical protein
MAKVTINSLLKSTSESVWVMNTSIQVNKNKKASNVSFEVNYGNGQIRSCIVHESWIPQDLSLQHPKSKILESPSFRECISRNLIKLADEEESVEMLEEDEDAQVELARLQNKYNSISKLSGDDSETSNMPNEIKVMKEAEDPNVNTMIKDLCIRDDMDPIEVYAKLRSSAPALTKEDLKYLQRNLHKNSTNEKIEKFIVAQLEEKKAK